LTRETPRIRR